MVFNNRGNNDIGLEMLNDETGHWLVQHLVVVDENYIVIGAHIEVGIHEKIKRGSTLILLNSFPGTGLALMIREWN